MESSSQHNFSLCRVSKCGESRASNVSRLLFQPSASHSPLTENSFFTRWKTFMRFRSFFSRREWIFKWKLIFPEKLEENCDSKNIKCSQVTRFVQNRWQIGRKLSENRRISENWIFRSGIFFRRISSFGFFCGIKIYRNDTYAFGVSFCNHSAGRNSTRAGTEP